MFSCDYNGWADVPEDEREALEIFEAGPWIQRTFIPPPTTPLLPHDSVALIIVRLHSSRAQPLRQVAYVDHFAFSHHACAAENTFQLPDVSRPRATGKHNLGTRCYAANGLAVLFSEVLDEKALQQRQVFRAIR